MREGLQIILNYDTETIKDILRDLDQRLDRNKYLISSAEAKLQRVDPESVEFEKTVDLINHTKKQVRGMAHEKMVLDQELKWRSLP